MPTESDRPEIHRPAKRGGRMASHAVVEEAAVWLEINRVPAVTWMCTPAMLEELAIGWLHGEGYIDRLDQVRLRPCATDLGFWAEIPEDRVGRVAAEGRRPVLASGCGGVATFLADPAAVATGPSRGAPPAVDKFRELFKSLFALGERYRETGGIHSAGLTDGKNLLSHAEDIGRHNAVDKVVGAALLAGRAVAGHGLLVTGRISAELAYKAARAGLVYVATPSVPSSLAVDIAERAGMILVGRAVSGQPQLHGATRSS